LILAGFSQEEADTQKTIMQAKLTALEEQAYEMAGHPFSLSSTDDISQVGDLTLFYTDGLFRF